jgi:hypothetical protein
MTHGSCQRVHSQKRSLVPAFSESVASLCLRAVTKQRVNIPATSRDVLSFGVNPGNHVRGASRCISREEFQVFSIPRTRLPCFERQHTIQTFPCTAVLAEMFKLDAQRTSLFSSKVAPAHNTSGPIIEKRRCKHTGARRESWMHCPPGWWRTSLEFFDGECDAYSFMFHMFHDFSSISPALEQTYRTSPSSWKIRMFHQDDTLSISPLDHNGLLVHHTTITESGLWHGFLLSRFSEYASNRPGSTLQASGSSPDEQLVSARPRMSDGSVFNSLESRPGTRSPSRTMSADQKPSWLTPLVNIPLILRFSGNRFWSG